MLLRLTIPGSAKKTDLLLDLRNAAHWRLLLVELELGALVPQGTPLEQAMPQVIQALDRSRWQYAFEKPTWPLS